MLNTPVKPDRFTRNEWLIIGLTSIGHAVCHIGELAYAGAIVAWMNEFRIDASQATGIATPGLFLYGICAIPAGLWTDRQGSRRTLTTYFFLVAVAALLVCWARSPWSLSLALMLLGTAISIYHPAGLTMITHGCRSLGRAMGINGVAGSLGVALGPYLAAQYLGWRSAYAAIAALAFLSGLATLLLRLDLSEPNRTGPSRQLANQDRAKPAIAVLFLAVFFGGLNYRCLMTALPTYLGSGKQIEASSQTPAQDSRSEKQEGETGGKSAIVFWVLALGGIGQFMGGHLADRRSPGRLYAALIFATIPFALFLAHGPVSTTAGAAALLAVFMFSQQPLENTVIADATPAHRRSMFYGLKFVLSFGLASSGAWLTGMIWKYFGLGLVFDLFALNALVMAALALTYCRLERQAPPNRVAMVKGPVD